MRKDILTEWTYGEGAIKVIAKVLMNRANEDRTLIGGVIAEDLLTEPETKNEDECEMWECELIIIPRKKFSHNKRSLRGWRIDQKLASGIWSNAKEWTKKIFDRKKED